MAWILGIIATLFFLWLMVVNKGFRSFILGLVALIAIGGFLFYQHNEQKEKQAREAISTSEVLLEDMTLVPEYSGYKLKGRVKNLSKHTLSSLSFRVTMRDCEPLPIKFDDLPNQTDVDKGKTSKEKPWEKYQKEEKCTVIGDSTTSDWLSVPPNQVRAFDTSVYFTDMPTVRGNLVWDYTITGTKAAD